MSTLEIAGSGVLKTTSPDAVRAPAPAAPVERRPARLSRGRDAITASAEQAAAEAGRGTLTRLDQQWQREAMRCYREIGECWNPVQYYSRAMERIRFYPARLTERGQREEVTEGPLLELFQRIQVPGGAPGDLGPLAGQYGRLQFLIGDGHLLISEQDEETVWEYLSPMELRLKPPTAGKPQEYYRLRTPGSAPEDLTEAPDDDFEPVGSRVRVYRLWRQHPEFSQWADSPIRAVLDLYRLLQRMTGGATAEASSRAAQRGAWYLPEELSFGPVDQTMDENPDEDPVIRELVTAMARAIANPESAEAMAPFFIRGPSVLQTIGGAVPMKDLIGYIAMGPEDRYPEIDKWDEVIGRIAGSIDMPKELMTGVGDVSHWGQWFLDDAGFRQHTGPAVVRFCNDIAGAYLRPAAAASEIEDAATVTVWFDPSQAINHPDETGVAAKAHDSLVISDEYYREKIGAPDSAAPSPEERKERVSIMLKQNPYTDEEEPSPNGEVPPQEGGRGGDVTEGPPPRRSRRRDTGRPPSPEGPSMAQMVAGAAYLQLDWTRERAGNRLRTAAQTCAPCQELIGAVASPMVPAVLGREQTLEVLNGSLGESELVAGTADRFALRLAKWGLDGRWPEELGQMVEQHALRTLYMTEVPPFPPGFMAAVTRAVA